MHINTTYLFLAPTLSHYGEEFVQQLLGLEPQFYGLGYKRLKHEKIVVATKKDSAQLKRNFPLHIVTKDISLRKSGPTYVTTIRIPSLYHNAYDYFMKGSYSKMYTDDQIDQLYTTDDRFRIIDKQYYPAVRSVLRRSTNLKTKLETMLDVELDDQAEVYSKFKPTSNYIL